jgi:hypothetical protein
MSNEEYENGNSARLFQFIKDQQARNQKKPVELPVEDYRNIKKFVRKYVGKEAQFLFYYEGKRLIISAHQTSTHGGNGFVSRGMQVWLSDTPNLYHARVVTYSAQNVMLRVPSNNG